ncbi:hypothetical protein ACFV6D_20935 [Kitasatospora sp. NPDC059812]|uniref:hypothetical protein n=1 Tax=unclassified Kitasatospora TaxID=2633591 RepID=UPI00365E0EC9
MARAQDQPPRLRPARPALAKVRFTTKGTGVTVKADEAGNLTARRHRVLGGAAAQIN